MMVEMEKLYMQFFLETHITSEERASREVGRPGKEVGGKDKQENGNSSVYAPKSMDPYEGARN